MEERKSIGSGQSSEYKADGTSNGGFTHQRKFQSHQQKKE